MSSEANSPVGSNSSPFYENAIRERFWRTHLQYTGVRYRGPTSAGTLSSANCFPWE
ncbi:hypothetical protein ACFIOZ_06740 [Vreelandella sp. F11]|uniref:hypothetical protein n=1 Tax=Vreelandella sp. F11 TaxID=3394751 RepID=UPI0036DD40A2